MQGAVIDLPTQSNWCSDIKNTRNIDPAIPEFVSFHLYRSKDIEKWCKRSFIWYEYDRTACIDYDCDSYKAELKRHKDLFFNPKVVAPFELAYVTNELSIGDKDWLSFVAQLQVNAKKPMPLTKDTAAKVLDAIVKTCQ